MPRQNQQPRINRDNVFLSREGATRDRFVLKAIDHGCCFTCEAELIPRLRNIDIVRDDCLYGLFPEFLSRIEYSTVLQIVTEVDGVERSTVEEMIATVPREWEVTDETRRAWCDLITQRARYIREIIKQKLPLQTLFDYAADQEEQP